MLYIIISPCLLILFRLPINLFQFQFTSFDLENAIHHDYVTVYNGRHASSPMLGRYTGNENPGNVGRSMTNNLLVEFHTDDSTTRQGFRAMAARHTRGGEIKIALLEGERDLHI